MPAAEAAALASAFLGQASDAVIIGGDPGGLGRLGIRQRNVAGLECDESVLTGEPVPVEKSAEPAAGTPLAELSCCALMGTVMGGRRIFANTMKYVLMGTSSNFRNMFSAAGAPTFLSFLPMLPSQPQILLNNLLYDSSQLAIPTDEADPEQVAAPTRWDVGFIRNFMLFFCPISSVFDFITFGVMLWGFHAGPALFRSGWFVESLATQTLVIRPVGPIPGGSYPGRGHPGNGRAEGDAPGWQAEIRTRSAAGRAANRSGGVRSG